MKFYKYFMQCGPTYTSQFLAGEQGPVYSMDPYHRMQLSIPFSL